MPINRYDCHLHSYLSPCSSEEMTPENIVLRAKELNLSGLCVTDHLHAETSLEQYSKLRREFAQVNTDGLDIWIGCEVNVYNPNSWSIKPEWIDRFDVILASPIHWIERVEKPEKFNTEIVIEYMCEMIRGAANCPGVNIIAHPFWFPRIEGVVLADVLQTIINQQRLVSVFKRAAKGNIAFEINPKAVENDVYEQAKGIYLQAVESGVKLSQCSDAHKLDVMDVWEFHDKFAEELGLSSENFWLPNKELQLTR